MKKYTWKEQQRRRCEKLGHDWALQDERAYMVKICLRCGATQFFFPEEVEYNADVDHDDRKEI